MKNTFLLQFTSRDVQRLFAWTLLVSRDGTMIYVRGESLLSLAYNTATERK